MKNEIPMPRLNTLLCFTIPVMTLVLVTGSCAPSPPGGDPSTPPSTTETTSSSNPPLIEAPQVRLPDGFEVTLELAVTPEELAQGLMFRPKLPDDRGMLLIFAEERLPSIWMMNTLVALDLVYLDSIGNVVEVVKDAQPCPGEPCPRFTPKLPARAVLEIPAGSATLHGVNAGDRLEFLRVPEFSSDN